MKPDENKHWLVEQMERHLFTILVGGVMVYSTFQGADHNTSKDISQINTKLDNLGSLPQKIDAIYLRVCRLEANAQLGDCK